LGSSLADFPESYCHSKGGAQLFRRRTPCVVWQLLLATCTLPVADQSAEEDWAARRGGPVDLNFSYAKSGSGEGLIWGSRLRRLSRNDSALMRPEISRFLNMTTDLGPYGTCPRDTLLKLTRELQGPNT